MKLNLDSNTKRVMTEVLGNKEANLEARLSRLRSNLREYGDRIADLKCTIQEVQDDLGSVHVLQKQLGD